MMAQRRRICQHRVRPIPRRDLIASLAVMAVAHPLAGHAQQPELFRRVGVLMPFPENDPDTQRIVTVFAQALGRFGCLLRVEPSRCQEMGGSLLSAT